MPNYEYFCPQCGWEQEENMSFKDRYNVSCAKCKYTEMLIVPSLPAKTTVGKYGKGGGK